MCFVTFTDLPCPFLSPGETTDESAPEVFYPFFDIWLALALPFNERLQTQQTTLNYVHKFIPNYVSHNSTAMCMLICNNITVD